MSSILILGGARSGKSTMAQNMAAEDNGDVLFVATAEAGDEEMRSRIEAHKKSRPDGWRTLETPVKVGEGIADSIGAASTVVIDCITLLVNNVFKALDWIEDAEMVEREVDKEIDALIQCIDDHNARFIIVSNELGLGIVPGDPLSRIYRDVLGRANQLLARHADEVYLLVAGIPVAIKTIQR